MPVIPGLIMPFFTKYSKREATDLLILQQIRVTVYKRLALIPPIAHQLAGYLALDTSILLLCNSGSGVHECCRNLSGAWHHGACSEGRFNQVPPSPLSQTFTYCQKT